MRWRQRPAGSNWGDFGPDDQLGRTNLIGPEHGGFRRAAAPEYLDHNETRKAAP